MSSFICLFLVCSRGSWRSENRTDQDEKEQKEQEKERGAPTAVMRDKIEGDLET